MFQHYVPAPTRRPASSRDAIAAERYRAIERVILAMSVRLDQPLSLDAMAEIAMLSPYHFNRIFRSVTGVPPFKFQAALRMDSAKRMLLTTRLSITDICFSVGYNSLGTFTTHFTRYVGMAPRDLRRLAEHNLSPPLWPGVRQDGAVSAAGSIRGVARLPSMRSAMIFIGLFTSPMPQGRPASCTMLTAPGNFRLPSVPDGVYYVRAAAVAHSDDPVRYLLPDEHSLCVGVGPDLVMMCNGQTSEPIDITVRRVRLTDPPLLLALPFLAHAYGCDSEKPH